MKRTWTVLGLLCSLPACGAAPPEETILGPEREQPEREHTAQVSQAVETCPTSPDLDAYICAIKQISDIASTISSIYSGGASVQKLLQLIGAIESPPTVQQLFEQLDSHLTRLGVALGDQNAAINRNLYLPNATANAEQTRQLAVIQRQVDLGSATFRDSRADAIAAQARVAFQRIYGGPDAYHSGFVPRRDTGESNPPYAQTGDLVYDWRLGVPQLMQIIAYRILVLSSADPEWGTTHLTSFQFNQEMMEYRTELLKHLSQMTRGVKCGVAENCAMSCGFGCGVIGTPGPPVVECQDVYSGLNAKYTGVCGSGEDLYRKRDELQHQIYLQMPLFEMRKMADQLYRYARPGPDLTESWGQIDMLHDTNLCLDIQWGSFNIGNPIWLWPCTWDVAQWWEYDRKSGRIENPWSGMCLDVQNGSTNYGTGVWLWPCSSWNNLAQKWSWDPEGGRLYSALGPDLVLATGVVSAQANAHITWETTAPDFARPQLWHAD